ncbi:hypothetical protein F3Y22_tig00112471pilonHSYRG00001 [Hibiscus syriacus]|uniref:Uncharacterized protein n=1 Tax=Hibiscus syriacus TaxID=106335 RepID=A0A6A2XXE5_HIBSY|nr:hypothetical protein F3Y22_tig00112471pilonHSYRG00001 [Hibiscus syriacus]
MHVGKRNQVTISLTPSGYSAIILFLLPLQLIAVPSCPGDCEPIDATDRDWPLRHELGIPRLSGSCVLHTEEVSTPLNRNTQKADRLRSVARRPTSTVSLVKSSRSSVIKKAILKTVGGIQRPQIDIRSENIAKIFDEAMGCVWILHSIPMKIASSIYWHHMLSPMSDSTDTSLVAGLLGVESGQDATIRAWLYEKANENVEPYNITVTESREPDLQQRPVGRLRLSYPRTPAEIARITYGTGDEQRPGGFFPEGANGRIAREYLYNDKLKVL